MLPAGETGAGPAEGTGENKAGWEGSVVGLSVGINTGTGAGVVVVVLGGRMWTVGRRGGPSDGFSRVDVPANTDNKTTVQQE